MEHSFHFFVTKIPQYFLFSWLVDKDLFSFGKSGDIELKFLNARAFGF